MPTLARNGPILGEDRIEGSLAFNRKSPENFHERLDMERVARNSG